LNLDLKSAWEFLSPYCWLEYLAIPKQKRRADCSPGRPARPRTGAARGRECDGLTRQAAFHAAI